jgi:hypothetical protein
MLSNIHHLYEALTSSFVSSTFLPVRAVCFACVLLHPGVIRTADNNSATDRWDLFQDDHPLKTFDGEKMLFAV